MSLQQDAYNNIQNANGNWITGIFGQFKAALDLSQAQSRFDVSPQFDTVRGASGSASIILFSSVATPLGKACHTPRHRSCRWLVPPHASGPGSRPAARSAMRDRLGEKAALAPPNVLRGFAHGSRSG